MELIISYIIIFAPALFSLCGGLIINFLQKKGLKKAADACDAAITTIRTVKDSNDIKEINAQLKTVLAENAELKRAVVLLSDELRHIHELHPDYYKTKGE